MEKLEQRLVAEMKQQSATLMHTEQWTIPMQVIHATYAPVQRFSMDILMKILLMTFDRLKLSRLADVSELLAVEHLFVEDLTATLIHNDLVSIDAGIYHLTQRGTQQLANGVFEEAQQEQQATLLYSPLHEAFIDQSYEHLYDVALPEPYAYLAEETLQQLTLPEQQLLEQLQAQQPSTNDIQTYISSVRHTALQEIIEIPCLAFVLYNEQEDTFFPRVWNVLLNRYDKQLEAHYFEHAITEWRTRFL